MASTTVSSGGTDFSYPGHVETWTVASSTGFTYPSFVQDPSAESEWIQILLINGTTWTVLRGANNSSLALHITGFTIQTPTTQPSTYNAGPDTTVITSSTNAYTIEWSSKNSNFDITLTYTSGYKSCTLTIPAPSAGLGAHLHLIIRQDGVGSRLISWPSNVFSEGSIPALQTVANSMDQFDLYSDDGTNWILQGVAGPSNSIDPLAVPGTIMCVEAAAQSMANGDTIVSSGGTWTRVKDRTSGNVNPLVPSSTGAIFHSYALPTGNIKNPYSASLAYIDAGVSVDALTVTLAGGGVSDYAVFLGVYFPNVVYEAGTFSFSGSSGTYQLSIRPTSTNYIYTGGYSFWNFQTGVLANTGSFIGPLVISISQGANSVHNGIGQTIRGNGVDSSNTNTGYVPTFTLTQINFNDAHNPTGVLGTSGYNDMLTTGAIVVTPCPPIADIMRIERWLAGLSQVPVTW